MKQFWIRTGALFMVLAILFSVVGCKAAPDTPETSAPEVTTTEATVAQQEFAALYDAAVEAVSGDTLALDITYERTVTVAGVSYRESGEITTEYWNRNTDDPLIQVKQEITYGDNGYSFEMSEIYSGGKVYQTLGSDDFYAELSKEDFEDRYVPLKMLDASLYTVALDDAGKHFDFSQATAGESWLVPEDAQLHTASGSADLDDSGKLKEAEYTASYRYGAADIVVSYTLSIAEVGRQATVPEDVSGYVLLDHIDAVYALEHAYGYLNQAKHVSSNSSDLIVSAAAAYAVQNSVQTNVYAVGDTYAVKIETDYSATDYSSGNTQNQKLVEKFIDGKYTYSLDDGREETDSSVDREYMQDAITELLYAWIMEGGYVESVQTTGMGSVLLLEFTGNEQLGEDMCADICYSLFNDSDLLDNAASSYETKKANFYLALDLYSMLPTAAGVQYEGAHIIDGQEYILSQQVDQSFDLAPLSAHDAIFDKPAPEEEPETTATPLFYRVTGANGQEMWLLGTVHVGDARTGYLPDEIYTALRASDAIAVECNSDAFLEQIEADATLAQQASACYYYSDGTMTKDHIVTPDLYESAMQLLKATGSYNFNAEYMKPHVWSSSFDNFYLRQGYALTPEKGVEERLLAIAKEENIPIYEVESSLFQMQMMANYSDHLQEFLMFGSMASGGQAYWEGVSELYELWCVGDETAMTEMLMEDSWEFSEEDFDLESLTGEDLADAQKILADLDNINAQLRILREEYDKAMSIDRNEGMLEVAKGYLESNETVFYAVGLAHLLVDNGLVNALRDAGYTVELVTYS